MADGTTNPQNDSPAASRDQTGQGRSSREESPLRRSRTSSSWVAVVLLVAVLVVMIVFIVQNTQPVEVSFLGWNGQTPLAVALLIAAAGGMLLATIVGSLRIWQLRRRVRRTGQ